MRITALFVLIAFSISGFQNCGDQVKFAGTQSRELASVTEPVVDLPVPETQPTPVPATPSTPPTATCYFWTSGIYPSDINQMSTYESRIGDVSLTWALGNNLGGEEIVGNGSYPNNFAIFPRSSRGTWDGAAIPAGVHLQVWSLPNFQGTLLIDEVGPKLLYSSTEAASFHKTFADSALQNQYPQSVRKAVPFPGLDCNTATCYSGSSKVTCQ